MTGSCASVPRTCWRAATCRTWPARPVVFLGVTAEPFVEAGRIWDHLERTGMARVRDGATEPLDHNQAAGRGPLDGRQALSYMNDVLGELTGPGRAPA